MTYTLMLTREQRKFLDAILSHDEEVIASLLGNNDTLTASQHKTLIELRKKLEALFR